MPNPGGDIHAVVVAVDAAETTSSLSLSSSSGLGATAETNKRNGAAAIGCIGGSAAATTANGMEQRQYGGSGASAAA